MGLTSHLPAKAPEFREVAGILDVGWGGVAVHDDRFVPHEHAAPDTHELAGRVPLGRAGTPADVAAAVEFLSSERARHVTGQDLAVAGGWML